MLPVCAPIWSGEWLTGGCVKHSVKNNSAHQFQNTEGWDWLWSRPKKGGDRSAKDWCKRWWQITCVWNHATASFGSCSGIFRNRVQRNARRTRQAGAELKTQTKENAGIGPRGPQSKRDDNHNNLPRTVPHRRKRSRGTSNEKGAKPHLGTVRGKVWGGGLSDTGKLGGARGHPRISEGGGKKTPIHATPEKGIQAN